MKKLYRSDNNRIICGVCSGIADYFNVDPTLIRLAAVILGFCGFIGVFGYLIAAIIIPRQSDIR